jgi:hypothetical protein
MLAVAAAVIFAIAFIINAVGIATDQAFSTTGLMLLGLTCLALHQAGFGPGWRAPRGRRR